MLIEKNLSFKNTLHGKIILLTGAGGGIGFEAAKSFAYMGASVIIAEVDKKKGISAVQYLNTHFSAVQTEFYEIDLAKEEQIYTMYAYIMKKFGTVDVLFNNAAMTAMGNVEAVPVETWDKSYRVNFRSPLLLTQLFLPEMKKKNSGVIVFVPSSGAAPYMGAYEVFKTAQTELCNTLSGELEDTKIYTYAIGPGLVKTDTAMREIEIVAGKMKMTTDEFYKMNDKHILGAEEAGCGFAISVLLADKYHGSEIGSIQALLDSGLLDETQSVRISPGDICIISPFIHEVITIYETQYLGWMSRNIFERQWVLRDFKKTVGMSADQFRNDMARLKEDMSQKNNFDVSIYKNHFEKLKLYFLHQHRLLQGFEKDPEKLKEHSGVLLAWADKLTVILEHF